MILRQEIISFPNDSCTVARKDDMDDAALSVLECSQTLLTNPTFTPWSWCYTRAHQSYTMAYLLSSLVHRQSSKHAARAHAFLASLDWESWLGGLPLEEHRSLLAQLYEQVRALSHGDLSSSHVDSVANTAARDFIDEVGPDSGIGNSTITESPSLCFGGMSPGFACLDDVYPFTQAALLTTDSL